MTAATQDQALPEFLLGPLSTAEGRARRARSLGFGFYHDSTLEPLDPRPGEPVTIAAQAGAGVAIASATLSFTVDGARPETDADAQDAHTTHVAMRRASLSWDVTAWRHLERWEAVIPGQPAGTRVRYVISALTTGGQQIFSPYFNLNAPEYLADPGAFDVRFIGRVARDEGPRVYEFYVDEAQAPDWLAGAVIYQIFVDRFAPDPGESFSGSEDLSAFQGGTLRGVLAHLDYLSELGVTCLWLTPIFPSPSAHGYDATDYLTVEPRLGTQADWQQLLEAAHARGMRVVLDFVANHVSNRHPAFVAASQDPTSLTRAWFYFRGSPGRYLAYYDLPELPILNPDHPAVREYLTAAACHWLAAGCDGFRLDHAHGVTHGFWSAFRMATRAARPDSVTFGEITDTPPIVRSYAGRMDGALDFHLLELLRSYFVYGTRTSGQFDDGLTRHFAYFGASLALPSFLDNHDMNRFLWVVSGDRRRLRLAALCQFTLPGPPIIYYGTEVGLSQRRAVGRLEEARLPMLWGEAQDAGLLAFYAALVRLRRAGGAAWSGPRRTLVVDDARNIYVYACGPYLVALNNQDAPAEVRLSDEPGGPNLGADAELLLASSAGAALDAAGRRLTLPAYGGAICRV